LLPGRRQGAKMTEFGPYLEFVRIQTEMNKLFESLVDLRAPGGGGDPAGAPWAPNVDIREGPDGLVVDVELPGVDPASLVVRVGGGNLTLEGNKLRDSCDQALLFHRRDRAQGTFRRVVPLTAPVNTHRASAMLRHGLLQVHFPKVPNKRGEEVQIPVSTGEESHGGTIQG